MNQSRCCANDSCGSSVSFLGVMVEGAVDSIPSSWSMYVKSSSSSTTDKSAFSDRGSRLNIHHLLLSLLLQHSLLVLGGHTPDLLHDPGNLFGLPRFGFHRYQTFRYFGNGVSFKNG